MSEFAHVAPPLCLSARYTHVMTSRPLISSLMFSLLVWSVGCNFDDSYPIEQDDIDQGSVDSGTVPERMDMPVSRDFGSGDMPPQTDQCVTQTESCNGVDDDCDGQVDEGCDEDEDGYCSGQVPDGLAACPMGGGDCDDLEPLAYPTSPHEVCGEPRDLDCDGAQFSLELSPRTLIQPTHEPDAHGRIGLVQAHAFSSTSGQETDARLMLLWSEKREVGEIWARAHDAKGAPVSPSILVSKPDFNASQFGAAVDPDTGIMGVVYTQKQDDAQMRLFFTAIDSSGQRVVEPIAIPFEYNTYLATGSFFFNFLEMHVQDGIFSIFFPFIETNIMDYYHVAYDLEQDNFLEMPRRIYSTTDLFNKPLIGSRRASDGARAGNYVVTTIQQGNELFDVLELDPVANLITSTFNNRPHNSTRLLFALSHGFDEIYTLESSQNTATSSTRDRNLTLARIASNGRLSDVIPNFIQDYRNTSNGFKLVKTGVSDITLFYHADVTTMAGSQDDLASVKLTLGSVEAADRKRLAADVSINTKALAYLPETLDEDGALFKVHTPSPALELLSYSLSGNIPFVSITQMLFPESIEDPYPYKTYPLDASFSNQAHFLDDGSLAWISLRVEMGTRFYDLHRLSASGQAMPSVPVVPEPEGRDDSKLIVQILEGRLVAIVEDRVENEDVGGLRSCTHTYRTYIAPTVTAPLVQAGSISVTKQAYTDTRGIRRCEPLTLQRAHLNSEQSLSALLTVQEHTDASNDPAQTSNVRLGLEEMGTSLDVDLAGVALPIFSSVSWSAHHVYTIVEDVEDETWTLSLYDLSSAQPSTPFHTEVLDEWVQGDRIRLTRVLHTPNLTLHLTRMRADYTADSTLLLFPDPSSGESEPQRIELGVLPLEPPAGEISSYDVYGLTLFDGEKFVISHGATFNRRDTNNPITQRFLRAVRLEDQALFPQDTYHTIPSFRSYSILRLMPAERGVLVLYQDDITHHVLHLDDELETELGRVSWRFDAGNGVMYEPAEMPRTTHLITNPRQVEDNAWSWYFWTDPDGTNNSRNTFYQMDVTCTERPKTP